MSKENVEIVRRFLERAQEEPDAVWDIFEDRAEWEVPDAVTAPDLAGVSRGPDGVRRWFSRWVGAFEDWNYEVEEMLSGENTVAAHIHQWGRGKTSGVPVDQRFWQVWTLRDGKAVRVTHCLDRIEALEAAGLSE